MDVRLPDGTVISNVPDDMSKADLTAKLTANGYDAAKLAPSPLVAAKADAEIKAPATLAQKIQSSMAGRIFQGARDPVDGGAQLLDHGLKSIGVDTDAISRGVNSAAKYVMPDQVADYLFSAKPVDKINSQNEKAYEESRLATTPKSDKDGPGFDVARLAGNIASPANAGLARLLPIGGATLVSKALNGVLAGGAGGLLSPVNDLQDGQSFAATKVAQVGIGAVTGGIAAPVLSKVGESIARGINRLKPTNAADASAQADSAIFNALSEMGQRAEDLSAQQMVALRKQTLDALKAGKQIDPAALMRKSDFDALGIEPTQGQITRDATQFAKERNLRSVAGVGEPIMNRFEAQNQKLQQVISALRGTPSEPYQAGKKIIGALDEIDGQLKAPIGPAYDAARDNAGRYAGVDVAGFSHRANQALDESMLGTYLPAETRNLLNDVSSGKIPLNVNNMVQMDRLLSTAQRAARQGTPEALAIGKVRDALNSANIDGAAGQDAKAAFDAARGLAKNRFDVHGSVPALGAVAEGDAVPDTFVKKYVLGGNVDDVQMLAKLLKEGAPQQPSSRVPGARPDVGPAPNYNSIGLPAPNAPLALPGPAGNKNALSTIFADPAMPHPQEIAPQRIIDQSAFNEARDQIGDKIMRSTFGENQAGDKLPAPERLAKAIREIGTDKLAAFFQPAEIQKMKQASRVAAYINSHPSAAPVNTSNTAGAVMSLLGGIPGVPAGAQLLAGATRSIGNSRAVDAAMKAEIPTKPTDLTPEQIKLITRLLSIGAVGGGELAASPLK